MFAIIERAPTYGQKSPDILRGSQTRLPWAWDGLCFGAPFAETSIEGYRDVVNNVQMTTSLGEFWLTEDRGNSTVAFSNNVNGYLEYSYYPRFNRPSTELTMYARFRRLSVGPGVYGGYICNVYEPNVNPWQSWSITEGGNRDGAATAAITVNGVNTNAAETGVIPTTEYVSAFGRWRSGSTLDLTILGDHGRLITSASSASALTGTITYNASPRPLRINAIEDLSTALARYSQAMVWSRRLSDTEITQLALDPFGWYSPRRETVTSSTAYLIAGAAEMRGGTALGGLR